MRVRLLRLPGREGPPQGGIRNHPRKLQPRDGDDRSRDGRGDIHRAAHSRFCFGDHPKGEARRAAPDARRTDRAQPRDGTEALRRPRGMRRRDDRRGCGRDSPRGGPQSIQGGDGKARTRHAEVRKRPLARRGRGDCKENRHMAAHHPPGLHPRRNRRRHRARRGRVPHHNLTRTRSLA